MDNNNLRAFSSFVELHAYTSWYHGAMIDIGQYKSITDAFDINPVGLFMYTHIPYITHDERAIKLIDSSLLRYLTTEDGEGHIHSYVHHQLYCRIMQQEEFDDFPTQLVLRSTIERIILGGEPASIWVKAEELHPFEAAERLN
ncbi:hypothetical protein GCM10023188_27590 [Pontibacter saemangeumensis]|uniref:Uncharacterized protein n=1 Tax=Pontibacter saemangeumensis TaxID=1084525 RepID=A0ABP8LT25_9BACT